MMNKRIRYVPASLAIGGFLAVSFAACVAWDAVFPDWAMRGAWAPFLPGFEWISVGSFLLGIAEAFVYGFWFALLIPATRWLDRRATVTPVSPA